jgi:ligand-binding SRPBCC domain-containing protein
MFHDSQRSGPFRRFEHTHLMDPDGAGGCWLTDRIEYELPFGKLGEIGGGWIARRKLERMFEYRHDVTRRACEGVEG